MAKKYTKLEDQFLIDYKDAPIKELADALDRSELSIKSRRKRLGLTKTWEELYYLDKEGNKIPEDMKLCPRCEKVLPLDSFYKSKHGTKGRFGICRECAHKENILKHAKNKNKIDETTRLKKELSEKIKDEIFICPSCKEKRKGSEFGVYGTAAKGVKKASYCRKCEIERERQRKLKILKEKGY